MMGTFLNVGGCVLCGVRAIETTRMILRARCKVM